MASEENINMDNEQTAKTSKDEQQLKELLRRRDQLDNALTGLETISDLYSILETYIEQALKSVSRVEQNEPGAEGVLIYGERRDAKIRLSLAYTIDEKLRKEIAAIKELTK